MQGDKMNDPITPTYYVCHPGGNYSVADPQPVAIEQAERVEPVAWREAHSKVIKALAGIVTVHTPDKLFAMDAIPRDPVMGLVQDIKVAVDAYSKTVSATPPTAPAQPDEQLLKFYGVYDYPGLVAAMEKHIEKLQSKLPTNPQTAIDAWNNRVPTAPAQPEPVASILICAESSGEFEAVIELDHPLPIGTKLYTHPTAPAQDLSRLEPFVHGLGKAILRELQAAPVQQPLNDFDIRGVLASRLLCWHRLTEAEAQDLICFFEGVRKPAAPAHPELPVNWAAMIHYPECWDTAVYPELRHAIHEVLACSGCSVCNPTAPAQPSPLDVALVGALVQQAQPAKTLITPGGGAPGNPCGILAAQQSLTDEQIKKTRLFIDWIGLLIGHTESLPEQSKLHTALRKKNNE